jgi:glycosyltransferase involved in cell wall biosynthesis
MSNDKKSLLLVSFCSLLNDPRPYKQIEALKEHFYITELACGPSRSPDCFEKIVNIPRASFLQKVLWLPYMLSGNLHPYFSRYSCPAENRLIQQHFDLVIVHDIAPAPLAFRIAQNSPVIFDLHDYLPRLYEDNLRWRLLFQRGIYALCREYLPQGSAWLTASEQMAAEYQREFGIQPIVTYNTPRFCDLAPSPVQPSRIRMVHHGQCAKGRSLENMLELMSKLDERFELHLYLVGEDEYYESFKRRAQACPGVIWHAPVPMTELSRETNKYDIGLFMLPANTFNHDNTIANKFFEFIQARLLTAVWPTKAMKHIIDIYKTGFYTSEFSVDEMARRLMELTVEDITAYKHNSNAAANILTGERSMEKIQKVALSLVNMS